MSIIFSEKNMMNVKLRYKTNPCYNVFDSDKDSFCSLVSWEDFKKNYSYYIEIAEEKREESYKYELVKRL